MELKENTKRNSKTYKKVIGYSQPWKMVTSEIIKFQTQSAEQQRQLSKLATEFLPEHLEICNWEKNMNYSLKKNGRWKILPKLKAVWREFADELADMETDVQVFDLGPRLGGSIVYDVFGLEDGELRGLYRNHGRLVKKTRLAKGKSKRKMETWEEGDPSKVEVIQKRGKYRPCLSHRKYNENIKHRANYGLDIFIFNKYQNCQRTPTKIPLKSHASDVYTRRKSRIKFPFSKQQKNVHRDLGSYNTDSDAEEDVSWVTGGYCEHEKAHTVTVRLEDLMVRRDQNKTKCRPRPRRDLTEKEKRKPIYKPLYELPELHMEAERSRTDIDEDAESESEPYDETITITETSLECLAVPEGWTVEYSQTQPAVCEVSSGPASVLLLLTGDEGSLQLQHTGPPEFSVRTDMTSLSSLCSALQEVQRTLAPDYYYQQRGDLEIFHPSVAARYLRGEGERRMEGRGRVDLLRMSPRLLSECEICLESCLPLVPDCGHHYCTPCWRRWLSSSSSTGRAGCCPHPACPILLDPPALHWLAGPEVFRSLQAEMTAARLRSDPAVDQCGRCGRVARRRRGGGGGGGSIDCVCGHSYCPGCSQPPHLPATCSDINTFNHYSRVMRQQASLETKVQVRSCPGCGEAWEKLHGCNHMSCPCGSRFCWGCGRPASNHRDGLMCGLTRVPLETKTILPLPTEVVHVRRIELFKLFEKCEAVRKCLRNIKQEGPTWLVEVVQEYKRCFTTISYGLLCETVVGNRRREKRLKHGVNSLLWLSHLLQAQKPSQEDWRVLVRVHTLNVFQLHRRIVYSRRQK